MSRRKKGKLDLDTLKKNNWDISNLSPEEVDIVKKQIRDLGQHLREKIKTLKKEYWDFNFEVDDLAEASRNINDVEGEASIYLSMLRPDEQLHRKRQWLRNRLKHYKQQYLDTLTGWYRRNERTVRAITGEGAVQHLADQLTAVFHIEWQEMYLAMREVLPPDIQDLHIYVCLRQILEYCYDCCMKMAEQQAQLISHQLHMDSTVTMDTGVLLLVKGLRKHTVGMALPYLLETVREEVRNNPALKLITKTLVTSVPPFRTYLDKIMETLWYMLTQEPPVHLEFSPLQDHSMYDPFMKPGTEIDYIVWPAVRLHKLGAMVSKGVAMFADETSFPDLNLGLTEHHEEQAGDDPNQYYNYEGHDKDYYFFRKK